jgi:DNA polymerase-3 subunit delta'
MPTMKLVAGSRAHDYNATMSWKIIGNAWAVNFLERNISAGTDRQAYLITGPDSIGKRTLAIQLAQRLMCTTPDDGPCCRCSSCRQIAELQHPDLHPLVSEEVDGTLKVESVREMQRQISLAPYQAERRVVLVFRAHEMSPSAANALLKTLEEPPAQVVLILTARSEQSLLPTMVSRCEVLSLRPVPQEELIEGLSQQLPSEKATLLGSLAAGLPGLALGLASDEAALTARHEAMETLNGLLGKSRIERFEFVEEITKGRDLSASRRRVLDLLEVWLSLWRDVMLQRYGAQVALANPDQDEKIRRIAGKIESGQAASIVTDIQGIMTGVTKNANLQLSMESLMLNLPYL